MLTFNKGTVTFKATECKRPFMQLSLNMSALTGMISDIFKYGQFSQSNTSKWHFIYIIIAL